MQARRRAQPSGTNSPSSSHPRLKHRARCAIFCRARHAAARVAPERGFLAGSNTSEPRGSAPRERDHRGGDHPVPSRTRQLSPPSPRVLQRQAAGGQGVALAEGAFLYAPREARGGTAPLRAFARFGGGCGPTSGVARAASRRAQERRAAVCGPWLRRRHARGAPRGPSTASQIFLRRRGPAHRAWFCQGSCVRVAGAKRTTEVLV